MPTLHLFLLTALAAAGTRVNPTARPSLSETLCEWSFDRDAEGWTAQHDCEIVADHGLLKIRSTGDDPYLHCGVELPGGQLLLKLRARSRTAGRGAVYWTSERSPRRGEDKVAGFALNPDGHWHETSARFVADGRLTDVRIDPGSAPGEFDIDWIRLIREQPHPLEIEQIERIAKQMRFQVRNHAAEALEFSAGGKEHHIAAGATLSLTRPIAGARPLEAVSVELRHGRFPPLCRTVFVHNPKVACDWIVRRTDELTLRVARDGSLAHLERDGATLALLAPVVQCEGRIPRLELVEEDATLRFRGREITLLLSIDGDEISVSIDAGRPCEGPVVRAVGALEQGLLAGVEHLGKGERSSSKLDIETEEHLRFAPDPMDVTMPLMSFVTQRAAVAMTWSDMTLQPVFATPNFFDAADDHRMALRGRKIDATIRIGGGPLEETIAWAVKKKGLPPLPEPPRSAAQQAEICLAALNGPLKNENGWGHCVQERWTRRPYADVASTVWRLTGRAPQMPELVPGGAHVRNGSIYFVTGRAQQWLDVRSAQVRQILQRQQPDGSFRYHGPMRRGHFEDTASGVCAHAAAELLQYAYVTGDQTALEAGIRALEFIKRFRTPRGAQTWEVPLHTPDLLASAHLVRACVRAYELTGKEEYLARARKWALSGVPFVYLWQRHPIMLYSTPPVLGATHWRHNWIGLPVQWVGGVYAYALTMLAPYDDTLDWNHLARGILISAEQQQYPEGPKIGLLPDSFNLPHQRRQPADINPCALVSLRLVLDGQLDFLSVAASGKHRIAAPFPLTIRDGAAQIQGKQGVKYQVIVDGHRVVDVESKGADVLRLE